MPPVSCCDHLTIGHTTSTYDGDSGPEGVIATAQTTISWSCAQLAIDMLRELALPPRSACGAIILPGEINQAPKYIIQRVKLEQTWRDTRAKTLSEANQD
jgi:hypothetical protein